MPLVPRHPEKALPDSEDAATGMVAPPVHFGIPQGTVAPYWVPLRRSPFLFPTKSPWFIIPGKMDISGLEFKFKTVITHLFLLFSFSSQIT